MTLCLGGPRHGQDVDATEPQSMLDIATHQPTQPRQSFVDLATATAYYLRNLEFVTANPVTGQPDRLYTHHAYVHETAGPLDVVNLLGNALMGRWFAEHGTLHTSQPAVSP